jgi:hypothetical protein
MRLNFEQRFRHAVLAVVGRERGAAAVARVMGVELDLPPRGRRVNQHTSASYIERKAEMRRWCANSAMSYVQDV